MSKLHWVFVPATLLVGAAANQAVGCADTASDCRLLGTCSDGGVAGNGGSAGGTTTTSTESTSSSSSASTSSSTGGSTSSSSSSSTASSTGSSSSSSSTSASSSSSSSSGSGAPAGTPCIANGACESGSCGTTGAGYCCAAACLTTGPCGATACDASGACVYPTSNTSCATAPTCTDNMVTTFTTCNGMGTCSMTTQACPGFLLCANATSCLTGCGPNNATGDANCVGGYWCDGNGAGTCQPKIGSGTTGCSRDGQCVSGVCTQQCTPNCAPFYCQ